MAGCNQHEVQYMNVVIIESIQSLILITDLCPSLLLCVLRITDFHHLQLKYTISGKDITDTAGRTLCPRAKTDGATTIATVRVGVDISHDNMNIKAQ